MTSKRADYCNDICSLKTQSGPVVHKFKIGVHVQIPFSSSTQSWPVIRFSFPRCVDQTGSVNEEKVMEEEAFMQLNHKDMKKWYGENEELKKK